MNKQPHSRFAWASGLVPALLLPLLLIGITVAYGIRLAMAP